MTLDRLHRKTRWIPGLLALWLLIWSTALAHACIPQLTGSDGTAQVEDHLAHGTAAAEEAHGGCDHAKELCTEQPLLTQEKQADKSRSAPPLAAAAIVTFSLAVSDTRRAAHRTSFSWNQPWVALPVYLGTARLRI